MEVTIKVWCSQCDKEYDAYSTENGEMCTNIDFANNCECRNHDREVSDVQIVSGD